MHVIDLQGNEYPLQATSTNDNEVNGNQSFSATIYPSKVNKPFISDIQELWTVVDHDDVEHKIIYCKRQGQGELMTAEVKAIPLFFDVLDNDRIYERYDGSQTAQAAFTKIFADTGFTFVLVDAFNAVDWEGFGEGESKLETFKRAIERYKCEFRIVGNTVYLENRIGRDLQVMYRHKLNASNIVQEIDAKEMWTYAKGYGNYGDGGGGEDWQNAKLTREYTSPLASILDIRHAPPIKNGNITDAATMDKQLKTLVDESLKISVSADIHDLRKQGYPIAQSQVGDRVFLIDERIGLDDEVRVVAQSITRDWKGNVLDISLTFGSEGLAKRHQSKINTAADQITDILNGRKELPLSALDKRVQEISKIINGNTNSVFKYMSNGVMGWNGDDPNYMTRYVGDAIGFSKDGGKTYGTAMSAELGIVADYITTGTLRSIIVEAVEIYGSLISNQKVTLNQEGVYVYKGNTIGASLVEGNLTFNDQTSEQRIGRFAATVWDDGETKGISMNMEKDRYISFGQYKDPLTGYEPMLLINPSNNMLGNVRGIHSNLPMRMNDDLWMGYKALRFGSNNNHNHASIYKSAGDDLIVASYQSVGLAHIESGGVANTKLSIHPNEVKVNVDTTFHGLNIRSYSDMWLGVKPIRFGDNPTHNHATIGMSSGRDLRLGSYSAIGLAHIQSGGVYDTKLSVDSNINHSWQDLDMHGWKILSVAEVQQSSNPEIKEDIKPWNESALNKIINSTIYEYQLKNDVEKGIQRKRQGLILSNEYETPSEFIEQGFVEPYQMASWAWLAIKEQYEKQEKENLSIKARLDRLEGV